MAAITTPSFRNTAFAWSHLAILRFASRSITPPAAAEHNLVRSIRSELKLPVAVNNVQVRCGSYPMQCVTFLRLRYPKTFTVQGVTCGQVMLIRRDHSAQIFVAAGVQPPAPSRSVTAAADAPPPPLPRLFRLIILWCPARCALHTRSPQTHGPA